MKQIKTSEFSEKGGRYSKFTFLSSEICPKEWDKLTTTFFQLWDEDMS